MQLLLNTKSKLAIKVGNESIYNSCEVKLLGIVFDSSLKFDSHVSKLCKKANQKLHALLRVPTYMNYEKRRAIMKSFITSQFSYCPLVWMFHSRGSNERINRIHARALRAVHNDNKNKKVGPNFRAKFFLFSRAFLTNSSELCMSW